ncbi:MAG: hypothetical protein ACLFWB_10375, partial [Armatimonadota bacterium]
MRLYHNVFDSNYEYGMRVSSSRTPNVDNVVYLNNIFSRNDPYGDWRQVHLHGGPAETVRFMSNCITGDIPGRNVVDDYDTWTTLAEVQSDEYIQEHGERYVDNVDVPPEYVAADEYNHALSETSPLRDAGRPLTATRGTGSGPLLPVEDPWYFYDGLGIDGEVGDMIVIGNNQSARVEKVDLQERELVLDREVEWLDGDPVGLAWSGAAPDMGVYEYGDGGRPSVQIVADHFIARPGQEITLRAVVRGDMEPSEFIWHTGYEDRMTGQTVSFSRDEPNDYPIRLQVIDSAGNTHRATGYV